MLLQMAIFHSFLWKRFFLHVSVNLKSCSFISQSFFSLLPPESVLDNFPNCPSMKFNITNMLYLSIYIHIYIVCTYVYFFFFPKSIFALVEVKYCFHWGHVPFSISFCEYTTTTHISSLLLMDIFGRSNTCTFLLGISL